MPLASGQSPADLAVFALAVGILPLVSIFRGRRIGQDPAGPLIPSYWLTIARGAAVTVLVLGLWRLTGRPLDALGLATPAGAGLYCFAIVGILAFVMAGQIVFFDRIVKPGRLAKLRSQLPEMKILPRNGRELAVFLLVAVTAGIWEELLYRGFLIWFLAPYATLWGAVALSTAVFALGHVYQGWRGLPRSGFLGLLFALGYVASGSLWWLIALHALIDVYGGLVAWSVMRGPVPAAVQRA